MAETVAKVVDVVRLAKFLNKNGVNCFSRDAAIQTLKNIETMKVGLKEETDMAFRMQVRDYIEMYTKVLGINLAQAMDAVKNPDKETKSKIVSIFGDPIIVEKNNGK